MYLFFICLPTYLRAIEDVKSFQNFRLPFLKNIFCSIVSGFIISSKIGFISFPTTQSITLSNKSQFVDLSRLLKKKIWKLWFENFKKDPYIINIDMTYKYSRLSNQWILTNSIPCWGNDEIMARFISTSLETKNVLVCVGSKYVGLQQSRN